MRALDARTAADKVNKNDYPEVISKIKEAAEAGEYSVDVQGTLSDKTVARLKADGFGVNTLEPNGRPVTMISW